MVLPSNSSMNLFPDNTLSNFRVKLAKELVLPGDWGVALTTISYPRSWYTIGDDGVDITIKTYQRKTQSKVVVADNQNPFTQQEKDTSDDDISVASTVRRGASRPMHHRIGRIPATKYADVEAIVASMLGALGITENADFAQTGIQISFERMSKPHADDVDFGVHRRRVMLHAGQIRIKLEKGSELEMSEELSAMLAFGVDTLEARDDDCGDLGYVEHVRFIPREDTLGSGQTPTFRFVSHGQNDITFRRRIIPTGRIVKRVDSSKLQSANISPGEYPSFESLLATIRNVLEIGHDVEERGIAITLDKTTRKISVFLKPSCKLMLSDSLRRILGFDDVLFIGATASAHSDTVYQFVADRSSPLLDETNITIDEDTTELRWSAFEKISIADAGVEETHPDNPTMVVGSMKTIKLSAGHYPSIDTIVSELRTAFNGSGDYSTNTVRDVRVKYEKHGQKVTFFVKKNVSLHVNKELSRILGYTEAINFANIVENSKEVRAFEASRVADLHGGYYNIHVYTNIVNEQYIGDRMLPILKVVPLSNRDVEYVTKEFEYLQYVRVKNTTLDEIHVQLRRDDGTLVPFERGRVMLHLHFEPNEEMLGFQ